MNESQLAKKFITALAKQLPGAVVFRNVSLYVRGIPDYSITVGTTTLWLEFKLLRGRKPDFSTVQAQTVKKLDNGLFVVFEEFVGDDPFVILAENKGDYEAKRNDVRCLLTAEEAIESLVQRIQERERHCASLRRE